MMPSTEVVLQLRIRLKLGRRCPDDLVQSFSMIANPFGSETVRCAVNEYLIVHRQSASRDPPVAQFDEPNLRRKMDETEIRCDHPDIQDLVDAAMWQVAIVPQAARSPVGRR